MSNNIFAGGPDEPTPDSLAAAPPWYLYCYSEPATSDGRAIKLHISAADQSRRVQVDQADRARWFFDGDASPNASIPGPWVFVHDLITGDDYQVRSYPCGAGCRCAAQARIADDRDVFFARELEKVITAFHDGPSDAPPRIAKPERRES